ncbi:MAG: carbonic anhydrase [Candidatus Andersenbacteria bacterium]|nr:hypothetical protein [bacterium]MDZ4225493.1 carbonic anhydrase [Candidatus Andersenbacteria bacterium]
MFKKSQIIQLFFDFHLIKSSKHIQEGGEVDEGCLIVQLYQNNGSWFFSLKLEGDLLMDSGQEHHGTDNVVLCCMDYRLRKAVAQWIDEHLGEADLLGKAGAAQSIIKAMSRETILDDIGIAINLHGATTLHIIDHIDCGAYGGSGKHADKEAEKEFHKGELACAKQIVLEKYPQLQVKTYVMDWPSFAVEEVEVEQICTIS